MKLESEESVDILSIMIRTNNFANSDLVDELLTFLAAGYAANATKTSQTNI
jgi:hypothetical protein